MTPAPTPPPTDRQWHRHLDGAAVELQHALKWVRRQANKGHAAPADRADLQAALALVRGVYRRRGLAPPDIDSRKERG